MSDFTPTPAQDRVLREVAAWLDDPSGPQWRYLAGFAGTGKTSLARHLSQDRAVSFAAFTGKAAQVLRDKGVEASTLHRLIYFPEEKRSPGAAGEDAWTTEFRVKADPLDVDLVVLDECSMIDGKMATDLLSFGTKVLVLGDPFQLPPVSGQGYFTGREPDWLLTEVHRQAAGSGILRLATDVREGRGVGAPESYGPEAVVVSLDEATAQEEALLEWCHVVLVGTHRYRHHFNKRYREIRGLAGPYPKAGDALVCLANDHQRGLLNGALWRAKTAAREVGHMTLEMLVEEVGGTPPTRLLAKTWAHDFLGLDGQLVAMPFFKRKVCARFDYGYALTVHKSQGSEYDRVLLVDESGVFREDAARWLYTGITRAAKQLVVVRR